MSTEQDEWYRRVAAQWGPALQRIARSCEADPDRRRDVLQDMHVAIWKSHRLYDGRCAERTWVYRIATNVAANHVNGERRRNAPLVTLDAAEDIASHDTAKVLENDLLLAKLMKLVGHLENPDRTIVTLYLEGLDAAAIGEVTGLSAGAIATRISRVKTLLSHHFREAHNG